MGLITKQSKTLDSQQKCVTHAETFSKHTLCMALQPPKIASKEGHVTPSRHHKDFFFLVIHK